MASSHSLLRRVTIGMSGQAFSRVILAINTVALVPVLIHAWGVDGYGQWLALTALASYLSYSNFGLVTTSANEMVMAAGADDTARARRTFQMSINLTIYIILPLILLILFGLSLLPISHMLHLSLIDNQAALIVIALSASQFWFQTVRGLMVAALYATGSYGFAYYLSGIAKLTELAAIAVAVIFFHGSQVTAAAIMATVGILDLALVSVWARRAAPWARPDLRIFDRSWLSTQVKPAIGFALSNLATQGILVQGPRVILSAMLGGTAVAMYAIYGTAMRLVDQLLLMVVMPLEVEIARSVGRNEPNQSHRLIILGTQFSWLLFIGVASGFMLVGPLIFQVWTHGRIAFSLGFMALYLLMSACNLMGRVSAHALISTNRLYGPSFLMVIGALLALGCGALLTPVFGTPGMVLGGIIGESINSLIAIYAVSRWLNRPLAQTFFELLDFRRSYEDLRVRLLMLTARFRARLG